MAEQQNSTPRDSEEPNGASPFERFEAGLRNILSLPKEQAEKIRRDTKKGNGRTRRAATRRSQKDV